MSSTRRHNTPLVQPFYEPPYDSPLEDEFARTLVKYAGLMSSFDKQVPIDTICGRFILDFVACVNNQVIAFECDGKDFHDAYRDEWRDAMILGSGRVTTIYRFRGSDLYYHLEDCLYAVSRFDPGLFSERGLINLTKLASHEVRSYSYADPEHIAIAYRDGLTRGASFPGIIIERRSRIIPPGQPSFWASRYRFAVNCKGGTLDSVIGEYASTWRIPMRP